MLSKPVQRLFPFAVTAALVLAIGWPLSAAETGVDEFGVPLSDTPPPMPKGYTSQDEVMKAALSNKIEVIIPGAPVPLPDGVAEKTGIEYGKGGGRPLLLDLYVPEKIDKPAPGLIFIHGGGWESGDRSDYKYYTVRYAKRGYVVATISYRFTQEAPFPAAVQDVKCAVRWMRANAAEYHVDPDRIAVLGGSAGGHLSMMIGYSSDVPELEGDGGHAGVSSRVQAVVNLYGPCSLDVPEARTIGVLERFIGKTYAEAPELYTLASPLHHVTKDDPPTLILHGTIDDLVPIGQSDTLAKKLAEVGVPCVYDKYEGWPHTMDLSVDVNRRCQWFMNKFLAEHLGGDKSPR